MAVLTSVQEQRLARKVRDGCGRSTERLVLSNEELVRSISAEYRHPGMPMDDTVQEGTIGLIKAIDRFDPDRGFKLSTYAYTWFRSSILRYL